MGVYQSCLGFLASTQPCILREVAMRHNPVIKAFYERLVGRAKSKTLALTACVRKILVILNAMVRQNQPWQLPDNLD